ncbi:hypothetical protein Aple_004360 [Acrocarpospora pleiomorpha]|uniref:THIF-type NAD/FAD binding fold domain-containing protein n=1 Tax=Acrocarpospora pleiomorpha TaxID=90975 RepID=A0A5M3XDC8_9ACTN|nr:ThiF family adenylyltransferase [Acrocarpospora pleiomorpha]GES17541.1 hypothetical protein Aple_004360 [Acrocarpospora pleiomorpha]
MKVILRGYPEAASGLAEVDVPLTGTVIAAELLAAVEEAIGGDGQRELAGASVVSISAGGVKSTLLYYLAAAGVGSLRVIDHDRVELSPIPATRPALAEPPRTGCCTAMPNPYTKALWLSTMQILSSR